MCVIVCCACASLYLLQAVAAGCDNAAWEVWDVGCALQVARGKVKKGRCEAICSSKSGRFLYLGWDNADAGFLMMADTFRPDVVQKINSPKDPTDTVKCLTLSPDGSAFAAASFDGSVRIYSSPGRADSRV